MIATPEIGFTGTQRGITKPQIVTLQAWLMRFRDRGAEWMNNGDCVGADAVSGKLWKASGGKLRLHIPANAVKRAFLDGDAEEASLPYLDRNRNIVDRSRVLVATPHGHEEELRSGTWSTVRYARKRNLPLLIIWPNGRVTKENWLPPTETARGSDALAPAQPDASEPHVDRTET